MKKLYVGKIPFSLDPKLQLSYDDQFRDVIWFDNLPFISTLQLLTYGRGRSSAVFYGVLSNVRCDNQDYQKLLEGCKVNIFMSDMMQLIQSQDIMQGEIVKTDFNFCKKGANYGLQLIAIKEK